MKTLLTLLLIIHIAAGLTALLVGLIPMFSQKGSRLHNRTGLVYVYCMITVAITALLLCGLQPFKMLRLFLTGIAVFSFYMCFTGWRATKNKKGQVTLVDTLLTNGALLVGTAMVGFGLYLLSRGGFSFFPILFAFFGVLTGRMAWADIRVRRQPALKMAWYFQHFTRMGGSYIATFTAAAVNNVPRFLPVNESLWTAILIWIMPSILGGLLIGRTVRYYRQKFAAKSSGVAVL